MWVRCLAFVVIARWHSRLSTLSSQWKNLNERFTKVSHSANKWCFHLGLNAITICYRRHAHFYITRNSSCINFLILIFFHPSHYLIMQKYFFIDFCIVILLYFCKCLLVTFLIQKLMIIISRNFLNLINNNQWVARNSNNNSANILNEWWD